MTEEEASVTGIIDISARALMSTVRAVIDQKRQIKVGITIQVGGKIYEKALTSPALDGDELVYQPRERPDLTT